MQDVYKRQDIRIHVLIRPRFGDFCYTEEEFILIREAVKEFKKLGVEGVVIGCLNPDGTLNLSLIHICSGAER